MPMGFFGRWEKNGALHIVLCVIGKLLTSNFFLIISRISLLVILSVFVLFYTGAVQDFSLMGICLPKFQAAHDFGKDTGKFWSWNTPTVSQTTNNSASHGMANAEKWNIWLNPWTGKGFILLTASGGKKKKILIFRYICTFPIVFRELSTLQNAGLTATNRLKVPVERRFFFFFPADILAVAFSRASLGAPWTPDTAKWQLPLALSTCHQSRDDQRFICPSCQGGCNIFLVIRCETFLQFESTDTTAGINRRHRL